MNTPELEARYTPEDLLKMEHGPRYELVDGHLVEKDMGQESAAIGTELLRLLGNHVAELDLGRIFGSNCGYQIWANTPRLVRYPDVSFSIA